MIKIQPPSTLRILSLSIGLSFMAFAYADTPAVTGLRADIYSSTAIELFWDRVPNQAMQYDIQKDGVLIDTIDGTSFFDPERSPDAINEYTVTAIDAAGIRSVSTTLSVGSFSPSNLQAQDLRGDVYSSTTAELFWTRVPDRNLHYEITRNDGIVGYTNGNSYYDASRLPGVVNDYTVVTIDEQGIRSQAATLRLPAFGSESNSSPAATGLRATIYSSTAAELFWDRLPNRALRYELIRNDGYSNIVNGSSYFDDKRVPDEPSTYLITTIDEEGNRSSTLSLDVPAFAGTHTPVEVTPTLNHENYIEVVRQVFDWFSGKAYNEAIQKPHRYTYDNSPISSELISTDPLHWLYEYTCDNTVGTATSNTVFPNLSSIVRYYELDFTACEWNSERFEGSTHYSVFVLGNEIWQHDDMRIVNSDNLSISATGTIKKTFSACGYGDYQEWVAESLQFAQGSEAVISELSNVNTRFGYGANCAQNLAVLEGSFQLRSPISNGLELSIDTPLAFQNAESNERFFETGILTIRAGDGSVIEVNADNGDRQSVLVSITANGSTDTFNEPWSTWQDSLVLDLVRGS